MVVRILPERREFEFPGPLRVGELLRRLDLLPGTAMVIRNNELLTDDESISDDAVIEIRRVISGG